MTGEKDGKWRCPTCGVEADVKDRGIHVHVTGHTWPLHWDCPYTEDIDHIDFTKLEKVS